MGKRGPKPTPTNTLKIRGSWRADTREDEPMPDVKIPDCPEWLKGEALKEWNRITPLLVARNVLTEWDMTCLALYCDAWGDYVFAQGYDRDDLEPDGISKISAFKNKAWDKVMKAAAEFGLTPASRTKVKMGEKIKQEDKKAKFFRIG
jgi:P27 family predicted phage terminase small subunit